MVRKAAAQGYADAAYKLGRLYDDAHDKTKAGQYYETARNNGKKPPTRATPTPNTNWA